MPLNIMKRLFTLLLIEIIFCVCIYLTAGAAYWGFRGHSNGFAALMSLFLVIEIWIVIVFGISIVSAIRNPRARSEEIEDSE
jgi:hypothetical protein